MSTRKVLVGALIVVAGLLLLSTPCVMAQDPCEGNFDCDQDVDGTDAAVFKSDFGRSSFSNPCPTCQDNPCPCPGCALTVCGIDDPIGLDICLSSGEGNCCCCAPAGDPLRGFCTDLDTCFQLPPHPELGPYLCI